MEPTDLDSLPADDALDAWLRQHAAPAPLPDAGFSTRVLRALPPAQIPLRLLQQTERERRAEAWRRTCFCAVGGALGVAACLAGDDGAAALAGGWRALGSVRFGLADVLSLSWIVGLTLASLALVYGEKIRSWRQTFA